MSVVEILNGLSRLVLGFVFMSAGGLKLILPGPQLAGEMGSWTWEMPVFRLRFLGVVEIVSGLALVVPLAFGSLNALAVAGLVMTLAVLLFRAISMIRGRERRLLGWNLAVIAMAVFILVSMPA